MRKHAFFALVSILAAGPVAPPSFAQTPAPGRPDAGTPVPQSQSGQSQKSQNQNGQPAQQSSSGAGSGADGGGLAPGANSFTESQAMSRISAAGYSDVTELKKDDSGIWRAKATKDGKSVEVGLDYKGNIAPQ